ncbi:MAG TPA: uracil-DNA glycosylase [Bacteroidales bacterium]|nr:uracil-DNA glycosylase [Bacteroidales bacterium]
MKPHIEESWRQILMDEFNAGYFLQLRERLVEEKKNYVVYPPGMLMFSAFNRTPFDAVKVVIIGQDPYHGQGQANGLCFSVSDGIRKPPSLENIFKELNTDMGIPVPVSGNLEKWADQGVLLLNASLSVRANTPNSHQNYGWHIFTDAVIKKLSDNKQGLVFLLWGKFAQSKESLIDTGKHYILKAAHPSPYSAYSGFFGCRHFSKANEILRNTGKAEIDWSIG